MCFTVFQNEKTPFQAIKTASSKSGKFAISGKGLTHGFGPKLAIFLFVFFFVVIGEEDVFYDSLERKSAFLGYKNSMFKKWKNCDFCKGVNPWFWSKTGHFSIFFFMHFRAGKCVLRYSRTKKMPFQVLKTRSLKSRKIEIFVKGLTHGFGLKLAFFPSFVFRQYRPGKSVLRYSRTKKCISRL